MASNLFLSLGGSPRFLRSLTRTVALVLFLGGALCLLSPDNAFAAEQYRLEGQVGLPHAGRVKQKVQVISFDVVTAPMRGGGGNTGSVSSAPGRWNPRDTYEYVEMKPLVFLQSSGDSRHCVKVDAPKGRFKIDEL